MNKNTRTVLNTLKHCNNIMRNKHDMEEHDIHNCTYIMNKAVELLGTTYNDSHAKSNSRQLIETCLTSFMNDTQNTLNERSCFICKNWVH